MVRKTRTIRPLLLNLPLLLFLLLRTTISLPARSERTDEGRNVWTDHTWARGDCLLVGRYILKALAHVFPPLQKTDDPGEEEAGKEEEVEEERRWNFRRPPPFLFFPSGYFSTSSSSSRHVIAEGGGWGRKEGGGKGEIIQAGEGKKD